MPRYKNHNWLIPWGLCVLFLLGGCSQNPVTSTQLTGYRGEMPANLGGHWERDYGRGEDVNQALNRLFRRLSRASQSRGYGGNEIGIINSYQDVDSIIALARLADLITRPNVLTIAQDKNEISIEREGDFSMLCEFFDGAAQGTQTEFGQEVCGWDGHQFVTSLILPDGLNVTHRFTIAPDGQNMHVATTVSSRTTPVPFTLNRFYTRFELPEPEYNCVDTLSRKRVCSTEENPL